MSVRELVLLIFWGISCILITVQIIKIRIKIQHDLWEV